MVFCLLFFSTNCFILTLENHVFFSSFLIRDLNWIQRFLPSEFGHDVDRADPVEPGLTMYNEKRRVRRLVEESGIPYTYICCNSIASWPYYDNTHPSEVHPPLDQFKIYGDGTVKGKARKYISKWLQLLFFFFNKRPVRMDYLHILCIGHS